MVLKMKKAVTSEKVVLTSLVVDISDVIMNVIVAMLSGSVIMLSQALEGGADLLASFLLFLGVRRSKRPSDRRHPLGYGRELYFWTFLAALSTFTITAGASFYFGFKRFINPEPISHLGLSLLSLSIALLTNGYSTYLSFQRLIGRFSFEKIREAFIHSALIATKTTFVLDLMGSIASVLGLLALFLYMITGNLRFDGLGAMAVGVVLAILAFFIINGAKDLLVGQSASPLIEEKIKKATLSDPNVKSVISLQTLHIGTEKLLVNLEINLSDELTTDEIEVLIDKIEESIKKDVPSAKNILIELESPNYQG